MTNLEFIKQLELALSVPTVYGTGAFGAPTGYKNNTDRYYENTKKNIGDKAADRIKNAKDGTFIFDCIGLGKGVVWNWCFNGNIEDAQHARYGLAEYKYDGIPDFSIKSMHKYCDWTDSKCLDPNEIEIGEWLRTSDNTHVAYYIGNGEIIECNSKDGKVVQNLLVAREWNGHGKLNYIEYKTEPFSIGQIICPHCGCNINIYSK